MRIQFGNFVLDPHLFELRCGGDLVPLEPKVLSLLITLVDANGRTVSRKEIEDKVWQNGAMQRGSLNRAIREARRALGDDGENQRVIRTVRGFGYRFVPKLRRTDCKISSPDKTPDLDDLTTLRQSLLADARQLRERLDAFIALLDSRRAGSREG